MTIPEILDILQKCDFEHLTETNYEYQIIDNIPENIDINYRSGVTKVAIFFPNTDFVIKIPFGGVEEEEEEYDEEYDEYYGTGDYTFAPFQFADDLETGDDYCKVETIRYGHALDFDDGKGEIAQLFARTSFIGYVHEYPIYAQPICESYSHRASKGNSQEIITSVVKTCREKKYNCFNPDWLADVVKCYGEQVFNDLCSFIKDEGITDLHSDNIGYYKNKPILFDYAGFND